MDPVTTILMQALAAFGNKALGELAKRTVGDAWDAVKKALTRKYGDAHEAPKLLDELRSAPTHSPQSSLILERIGALRLADDPEVDKVLKHLEAILASPAPGVATTIVQAQNIYGPGNHSGSGTVNIYIRNTKS